MAMVVKNNTSALKTLNTLNSNTSALSKSLKKVSSGMRINSAADDASGYAISERMRVQIRSLEQDKANAKNGASMLTVAEGAISNTVEILKTMKEKAINAANDTNTDADRATIQKEVDQSIDQINDNANVTFNGQYLIDGSKNKKVSATSTALTNQSLSTATTASTKFTELCARNGDSLGILSTDTITVSFVRMGITSTTSFTVGDKNWDDVVNILNATDEASKQQAMDEALKDENGSKYNTAINDIKAAITATEAYNAEAATLAKDVAASNEIKDAADFIYWLQSAYQYNTSMSGLLTNIQTQAGICAVNGTAVHAAIINLVNSPPANVTAGDVCQAVLDAVSASLTDTRIKSDSDVQAIFTQSTVLSTIGGYLATANNTVNATGTGLIAQYTNALDDSAMNTAQTTANNSLDDAGLSQFTPCPTTSISVLEAALATAQAAFDNVYKDKLDGLGTFRQIRAENTTDFIGLDGSGNSVYTASGENALTIRAAQSGLVGQIAGFTIYVTDNKGNVRKSANAALDAFEESIRAVNATTTDRSIILQIGTKASQSIAVGLTDMRAVALGLQGSSGNTVSVGNQEKANAAINTFDSALQKALDEQTKIGSVISRLGYTEDNLVTAAENVTSAESVIRDADMAKEMTEYTKNNILMQAAQAMLAQANQNSSNVLSLLQ